jgi:hypothetical protein
MQAAVFLWNRVGNLAFKVELFLPADIEFTLELVRSLFEPCLEIGVRIAGSSS